MISLKRFFIPRTQVQGFEETIESWSKIDKATFMGGEFSLNGLEAKCIEKNNQKQGNQRELLYLCLSEAYSNLKKEGAVDKNIDLLKQENTMTITTGHQLSLGLGPMFLLYKIIHVIRLCEFFNKNQFSHTLVPIFWLASEDHDFDEVKEAHFFNKTFSWETSQTGAVGRFNLEGLSEVYEAMKSLFPSEFTKDEIWTIGSGSYAQHYRALLHRIFGKFGLVIIDGDDPRLKRAFSPIIKRELETMFVSKAVEETNVQLQLRGKKIQAHARPVNLFYLTDNKRSRIINIDKGFNIDDKYFSQKELIEILDQHPERFSPNVLFRPLYQEYLLPNVCYIGGGGELAYWAQLKGMFQKANVVFPLVQTRVSAFISISNLPEEYLPSYFMPIGQQIERLIGTESHRDEVFKQLDHQIQTLFNVMNEGITTLGEEAIKWSGAQRTSIQSSIEQYKHRWQKEQKQQLEIKIKRLERIHQVFYPTGIPQERHTHLLHFCGKNKFEEWIDALMQSLDPFCEDIHIFVQRHETE